MTLMVPNFFELPKNASDIRGKNTMIRPSVEDWIMERRTRQLDETMNKTVCEQCKAVPETFY